MVWAQLDPAGVQKRGAQVAPITMMRARHRGHRPHGPDTSVERSCSPVGGDWSIPPAAVTITIFQNACTLA
jgi:hypothetical protein